MKHLNCIQHDLSCRSSTLLPLSPEIPLPPNTPSAPHFVFFLYRSPHEVVPASPLPMLHTLLHLSRHAPATTCAYNLLQGLKSCMRRGYSYIEGVEALLIDLKKSGYEMHAFTNYPIWYEIIEEKLKLSTYLSWTFCSCIMGKRKPDPNLYIDILKHLKIEPACCIFIDDRMKNVEAALDAGFIGIQFKNVDSLRSDLGRLGIVMETI